MSATDALRLPEVEARDRRAMWVETFTASGSIALGLVWLVNHLDHPVQALVLVPNAVGLPRVVRTLWSLNGRRRARRCRAGQERRGWR